ncbi:THAP domain-containing protein 9 [Plakobranchus ocellatus]|uniref:THAP domain-containing protein 9 n=1 Tax=Plakobranchus ocellatus TaxID=259542 RepID=A0AAV4BLU3_9GAST|nr:THAP domain-containing protein 9 [Plakobranchus ocellatus]
MPPFSHPRVCLAAQVLSHSIAAGISAMVTLQALPPETIEKAKFAEQFDRLFNLSNSNGLKRKNVMAHEITPCSTHIAFLEQSLEWLTQVKYNNCAQFLPYLDGWRLKFPVYFCCGWIRGKFWILFSSSQIEGKSFCYHSQQKR